MLVDLQLTWRLGVRAVQFDAASRTVTLEDGERVGADGVVIATGARTRTLPGTEDLAGVYTLRTLADSLAIRSEFEASPGRVVVVGAGFIGAEVAATARGRGLDVTMVEMAETPLERVLGAELGRVCADVHVDHGVDLRLGVGVESINGADRVEQVVLTDGTRLDADVVIVGVGVIPNTDWLEGSGLEIDNGVVCDETCLAAPGVVAAGDVARWPNRCSGSRCVSSTGTTPSSRAWRRPAACWRAATPCPSRPCRGSGAINTTARSSSPAVRAPTTRWWL